MRIMKPVERRNHLTPMNHTCFSTFRFGKDRKEALASLPGCKSSRTPSSNYPYNWIKIIVRRPIFDYPSIYSLVNHLNFIMYYRSTLFSDVLKSDPVEEGGGGWAVTILRFS